MQGLLIHKQAHKVTKGPLFAGAVLTEATQKIDEKYDYVGQPERRNTEYLLHKTAMLDPHVTRKLRKLIKSLNEPASVVS